MCRRQQHTRVRDGERQKESVSGKFWDLFEIQSLLLRNGNADRNTNMSVYSTTIVKSLGAFKFVVFNLVEVNSGASSL